MKNGTWVATLINSALHIDVADWATHAIHIADAGYDAVDVVQCDGGNPWCGMAGDSGYSNWRSVMQTIGTVKSVPWPKDLPAWVETAPNISQWFRNSLKESSKEIWQGIQPTCDAVADSIVAVHWRSDYSWTCNARPLCPLPERLGGNCSDSNPHSPPSPECGYDGDFCADDLWCCPTMGPPDERTGWDNCGFDCCRDYPTPTPSPPGPPEPQPPNNGKPDTNQTCTHTGLDDAGVCTEVWSVAHYPIE